MRSAVRRERTCLPFCSSLRNFHRRRASRNRRGAATAQVDCIYRELAERLGDEPGAVLDWNVEHADTFVVQSSRPIGEAGWLIRFAVDELLEIGVLEVVGNPDYDRAAFGVIFDANEDVGICVTLSVGECQGILDQFALLLIGSTGILLTLEVQGRAFVLIEQVYEGGVIVVHGFLQEQAVRRVRGWMARIGPHSTSESCCP